MVDRIQLGTLVAVYDENGSLSKFVGHSCTAPLSNAERDDIFKYFGEQKLVELEGINRRFNRVQATGFPPAGCRTAPPLVPGVPATQQPVLDMLVKDAVEREQISDRFDETDPEGDISEDAMSEILEDVKAEDMVALKEERPDSTKREDSEDDMKILAHPALRKRKSSTPLPMRPRKGRLAGVIVIDIED